MNYVNEQNMQEILDGIARKIGQGGGSGAGLEDWQPSTEYNDGDIFVYEGQIYKSYIDFTSSSTFSNTELLEEYELQGGETPIPFAEGTSISTDDIISYDTKYYKALTNFVCGAEFSLYTFNQYVPVELTAEEEQEIIDSFNPQSPVVTYSFPPATYQREKLFDINKTTVTIYPLWVSIGNNGYILGEQKVIDITDADNWDDNLYITASQRAGKDFYIFAIADNSGEPKFILSANKIVPNNYTINNTKLIGGFHCLCADVGTISGHTLSGYVAGDILPLSVWDLNFRANSDNDGMVYIKPINKWVDIYLSSWDSTNNVLVSKYNQAFVTGTTTPAMHGFLFMENYEKVNKILPSYDEFTIWAKGSAENVAIQGAANPITTGGHNNTAGSRIISNYGIEDSIGVLWQWTRDNTEYSSSYAWNDAPVYASSVDSVKRGSCYGSVRRLIVGGAWSDSSYCGSRCVAASGFGASVGAVFGGRGSSACIIKQ